MNIKELILKEVKGMKGVNGNEWKLKLSNSPDQGYSINIVLSNSAIIKSDFDCFSSMPVRFKLHFKLSSCGFIEFFCVTVDKTNNRGGEAQTRARNILKPHYSYLRQQTRAA